MGRRGQRRARRRCGYVDPLSTLRCRRQVKKPGRTFCSHAHAIAARPKGTRNTAPGARARHHAAQEAILHRLIAAINLMADDRARVPLVAVRTVLLDALAAGYERGYAAGHRTGRQQAHALRLESSRVALDAFLGSRFGKSFITGTLQPEDLSRFSFKRTRR